jgi:mycofactocin precursor
MDDVTTRTDDAVETTTRTGSQHDATGLGELVLDELLVEEISIDGMCGVY